MRPQLDTADNDGREEENLGTGKVADALIDVNRQFNACHQHRRNRQGLERQGHNQVDGGGGNDF